MNGNIPYINLYNLHLHLLTPNLQILEVIWMLAFSHTLRLRLNTKFVALTAEAKLL